MVETAAKKSVPPARQDRLQGIDSIRFVMALWVTLGHLQLPPLFPADATGILEVAAGIYNGFINGPAAVIVFFLVSGLCIHYPNRRTAGPLDIRSFYTRRLVRIGLPLAAAIPFSFLVGGRIVESDGGILWSLIAEIIYYLLYPALLMLRKRFSWQTMIAVAYGAAVLVTLTKPGASNYPSFGPGLDWVLGLPVWMLGCLIAERSDSLRPVSARKIWTLRAGVLGASWLALLLRWHLPGGLSIGDPWTLNVFALAAYVWLSAEVSYYKSRQPYRLLEAVGAWSYSLYLMHLLSFPVIARFHYFDAPSIARSVALLGTALSLGWTFYHVVERPSHRLAVFLGRRARRPDDAPTPAAAVSAG